MAVNRFSKPSEQHVMNTYVPLPFQEILAAGQARQQRYDQGVATMEAYSDALTKLNAMPVDKQYLQEKQQQFQGVVENLAGQDLSDPTVNLEMRKQIKGLAADPTLRNIQQSYAQYQKGLEQAEKLRYKPYQTYASVQAPYEEYVARGGAKTGTFQYRQMPEDINIEKELTDKYLQMPTQEFTNIAGTALGNMYITKDQIERRDPKIVAALVASELQSNPNYRFQKQAEAVYAGKQYGVDANEYYKKDLQDLTTRVANFVAVDKSKRDLDTNAYTLDAMQAARKKKEEQELPTVLGQTMVPGRTYQQELTPDKITDALTLREYSAKDIPADIMNRIGDFPGAIAKNVGEFYKGLSNPTSKIYDLVHTSLAKPENQKSILGRIITGSAKGFGIENMRKAFEAGKHAEKTFRFATLDPEQKNYVNQIMANQFGMKPETIRNMNRVMSGEIKDKNAILAAERAMSKVRDFINKNYSNANLQITDPVNIYDNKSQEALTKQLFGTTEFSKKSGITGFAANSDVMLPDGSVVKGSQLHEELGDLIAGGANVRVIGAYDPRNSAALRDPSWANSVMVNIGSGAETQTIRVKLPDVRGYDYAPTIFEGQNVTPIFMDQGTRQRSQLNPGLQYQTTGGKPITTRDLFE